MTRRQFLQRTAVFAAATPFVFHTSAHAAAPEIEVLETRIISHQPELYHGWPTVARRSNGQLLLVYSGGREGHVCPFGRLDMMVSSDEGRTWGWPQVILDSAMDDRDGGVMETARGTILATTFTSVAYVTSFEKARKRTLGQPGAWPEERLKAWEAAHERLTAEQRKAGLGQWIIRSTDGGATWSARRPTLVNSPHGPIQLADGRLLYPGKDLHGGRGRVGVCESRDDGSTWRWVAEIPTRDGDDSANYHELHGIETSDGRILVQIRNHNKTDHHSTLQTESTDGGKTWTVPRTIGVWGLPSHLMKLRDGRLLMTYGHRRAPWGNQARVSNDQGRTWSEPVIISGDGTSGDLGYPSTVQLQDSSLLTVWYELTKSLPRAVLRQARWRLKG